jgi:hypothetical protein
MHKTSARKYHMYHKFVIIKMIYIEAVIKNLYIKNNLMAS